MHVSDIEIARELHIDSEEKISINNEYGNFPCYQQPFSDSEGSRDEELESVTYVSKSAEIYLFGCHFTYLTKVSTSNITPNSNAVVRIMLLKVMATWHLTQKFSFSCFDYKDVKPVLC